MTVTAAQVGPRVDKKMPSGRRDSERQDQPNVHEPTEGISEDKEPDQRVLPQNCGKPAPHEDRRQLAPMSACSRLRLFTSGQFRERTERGRPNGGRMRSHTREPIGRIKGSSLRLPTTLTRLVSIRTERTRAQEGFQSSCRPRTGPIAMAVCRERVAVVVKVATPFRNSSKNSNERPSRHQR